jgi:hypothetical protein
VPLASGGSVSVVSGVVYHTFLSDNSFVW